MSREDLLDLQRNNAIQDFFRSAIKDEGVRPSLEAWVEWDDRSFVAGNQYKVTKGTIFGLVDALAEGDLLDSSCSSFQADIYKILMKAIHNTSLELSDVKWLKEYKKPVQRKMMSMVMDTYFKISPQIPDGDGSPNA